MSSSPDLFRKAFYLGVGLASYAGEQVNHQVGEWAGQFQAIADDMIRRGEMTTEQANQWLGTILQQEQRPPTPPPKANQPQVIEIETLDD